MIPDYLLPHEVIWQRPGLTTDGYGNVNTADWTAVTSTTIRGRLSQSAGMQDEETNGRQAVTADWTLHTNELGIGPADRILHDGVLFEVVGQPYKVAAATPDHHLKVRLRAVLVG